MEWQYDGFVISDDPSRLDFEAICGMLRGAYWAQGRRPETVRISLDHSLCFGIYLEEQQVGLARVVTDYATFAWLCDVIIHEDQRGRGMGKALMAVIVGHPALQGVRRWMLATRDAHGLYSQFGFTPLANPERWMEIFDIQKR